MPEEHPIHIENLISTTEVTSPDYVFGDQKIPALSVSATRAPDGKTIHVSLVNTDPHQPLELKVALAGIAPTSATGRLLTAPSMQAHNTFAAPDAVKPVDLRGVTLARGTLELRVPAMAVVIVELR